MNTSTLWKQVLAEFVGTYFLVFFGTGAVIVGSLFPNTIGHLGISVAFGLVVLCMIYAVGSISGAHLNPAVSIAFLASGRMKIKPCIAFIGIQIIAAIVASYSLLILYPETTTMGETLPAGTVGQTFLMEFILSFFLMFVIINVATGSKEQGIIAGIAIGFAVLICALVGGPTSGASMNPARSIGPALVSGELQHIWVYIVSPIVGMLGSIVVWKVLVKR